MRDLSVLPVWEQPIDGNLSVAALIERLNRERRAKIERTLPTGLIPMDKWDRCEANIARESLRGRRCYGGLEQNANDVSSFVLLFEPAADDPRWRVLAYFFTDYGSIGAKILELYKEFDIREIAFDRWNTTSPVITLIKAGLVMVSTGQGFVDMSAPTKRLLELVLSGNLAHNEDSVLRQMAANTMVKIDPAGNIKPDRCKSSGNIAGIVALIMALHCGKVGL
jgi:phage terminase large subunit-like protein